MKLVNLVRFRRVVAEFAKLESVSHQIPLAPIVQRTTLTKDDTHVDNGTCAHCGDKRASKVCRQCFSMYSCTFYCNPDHQARDWCRHRFECKPLPDLILPVEATEAIMENRENTVKKKFVIPFVEAFKVGDPVVITYFANHRYLFIRSLKEDFDKLESDVRFHESRAAMLTESPEIGDTVLAPLNGTFVRALVTSTDSSDESGGDGSGIRCFFVDYGMTLKLPWNNLKKLGYKPRAIPRQTFKVILSNVPTLKEDSFYLDDYLRELMVLKEELEIVNEECRDSGRFVVLKVKGRDEVINDRINQLLAEHRESQLHNDARILFNVSHYLIASFI